ncbi:unnamed protein product [Plutella xylostella]|uniref:(diamondback moth) hypothetical protein n=1 Tax=Plutella xylostella TaxID=51655 RepID=A0A8S4ECQ3_PLUXY|nr:unnamed protein product [Plutella xylostella]
MQEAHCPEETDSSAAASRTIHEPVGREMCRWARHIRTDGEQLSTQRSSSRLHGAMSRRRQAHRRRRAVPLLHRTAPRRVVELSGSTSAGQHTRYHATFPW